MSDINSNIVQSGAPGTLLRSAAEAVSQDPTKTNQPAAQPNSPIRQLTQNPLESTIPTSTPRVINVNPVQQPSPDFTGLHAMLSSAPVPPPHVASSLIRAMMTPPGSVVAPSMPGPSAGGISAPQSPSSPSGIVSPAEPQIARPAQANTPANSNVNRGGGFSPVNASIARPSVGPSFTSAPSGQLNQPTTMKNLSTPMNMINSLDVAGAGGFGGNLLKGAGAVGEDLLGSILRRIPLFSPMSVLNNLLNLERGNSGTSQT